MNFLRGACLFVSVIAMLGACSSDDAEPPPTGVAPTPTPTPVPTPEPTPVAKSCTLEPREDCGDDGCCRKGGDNRFDAQIAEAQAAVVVDHPDWFRTNGSLRVGTEEYTAAVAAKITELHGLCTRGGDGLNPKQGGHSISSDEVGIKADNGLSQNVDVVIGSSNKPAILGRWTCQPASF
jgi:hypothetical protein